MRMASGGGPEAPPPLPPESRPSRPWSLPLVNERSLARSRNL
jgi:hypothetical protein